MIALLPDTDRKKFFDWYKWIVGEYPTEQYYQEWKASMEAFAEGVKMAGIESVQWSELANRNDQA